MYWIRGRQHQIPACPFHKQLNNKLTQHFSHRLECFFHALKGSGQSTMLANSEFVALLKQANTDSSKMAEVIGVSEAQLRFVTNTASGMGLIKCGSVAIPFDNQISKDTDLYRLYDTNIHEKIAMMKKEKLPEKVIERSGES